jgi:hypothetical protein
MEGMTMFSKFTHHLSPLLVIGLLCLLASCGATPPATSANLHITFTQDFEPAPCPTPQPDNVNCLTVSGQGTTSQFGTVSFQRTAFLTNPAVATPCAPASTTGKLIVTKADTAAIMGNGSWCSGDGSAKYTITVKGGTGKFRNATGRGTITVPVTGGEVWAIAFSW